MSNWNLMYRLCRGRLGKLILFIFFFPCITIAQQNNKDTVIKQATLINCVHYAIAHNPDLKNAKLNEDITEAEIKIRLADWYPQLNFNYNYQRNFQLPTINFNNNVVRTGTNNTSGFQFGATQNIFSSDLLLASRSSGDVRLQSRQNTTEQNINIASMVSKAFYDVLLTKQQINVTQQDIVRIDSSLKDAYYQYQSGIT
ncbi:MAG: TolC family protein, partial [Ginsengibacter sp.]